VTSDLIDESPPRRGAAAAEIDVLGLLMLAFDGFVLPAAIESRLASRPAAGITLFRYLNVAAPAQLRALVASVQAAAARRPGAEPGLPLLVAADQECGQLLALGEGTTPFAGNMALGATRDEALAERVAAAIGLEMRALGANVAYTPSCDIAGNPANPGIGIRSFGDDPAAVGRLAAAHIRGLHSAGVAATAKHFPGLGDVTLDSHLALPVLAHDRRRLDATELVPFRAAIDAGADVVMSAHLSLPRLGGDPSLPATLSRAVMHDLLRGDLGFDGLSITDALDMAALPQGPEQVIDVIAAIRAGVDVLLCPPNEEARLRIEAGLDHAAARRLFDPTALHASRERLDRLRRWVSGFGQPPLEVVRSAQHLGLARELAERSITLVRDDPALLPLRSRPGVRLAAIMPLPRDLTPADTSSTVVPSLAAALRAHGMRVDEFVTSHPPTEEEIAALRTAASGYDAVVVGTLAASLDPAQVALVDAILDTGRPTVTVAMRTPWDLAAYPRATTHVCTYGILPPSMDALAAALFGAIPFRGRLPVTIPGVARTGDGIAA
jgi:beta-N-acetylhexosaminidase